MEKTVSDRCFHTGWVQKFFKTALECDGLYDNPWTDAGSVGALLVTAIVLAAGRIDQRFALFLGLSAIMMNLQVASSVMAQAAMFVIVFLNVIILTRSQSKKWWSYLFFLIGMVSVYFDWFTFPVITYCVPMLSVLCMEWKENAGERKAGYYMHLIFEKGVLWCLGYGLMLLSKTAVSTVFAGKSALAYFLGRVTTNAGMVAGNEESAISMTAKALIKCFNGILPLTFVGRKMLAVIVVLVLTPGDCASVTGEKSWAYGLAVLHFGGNRGLRFYGFSGLSSFL